MVNNSFKVLASFILPSFIFLCFKDLCEGATYYADLIHTKLKQAGYYDDVGVFDVTEQVHD